MSESEPHATAREHHDDHEEQANQREDPRAVHVREPTEVHDVLFKEGLAAIRSNACRPRPPA
jgi:hypothetical protein